MSGNTALQKKMIGIVLSAALVFLGAFSFIAVKRIQGNARVINYAGVVRGATQKLIKEELQGQPDDQLISRLDNIIDELLTGEGDLGMVRLNSEEFQNLMVRMKESWKELKEEIQRVRQGADKEKLFNMSQDYFELADQTVSAAEVYTEKNANLAERWFIILMAVFSAVAFYLIWLSAVQNRRQKALQKAEDENLMKRERLLKMALELQAPMNEISELIYVSDVENYDLLFVNETGKREFHLDDIEGVKCYKAIQGKDSPCSYCPNSKLKPGENYTWEITNPLTKRHYLLKDRLIEWDGRKSRMEIAFDMTEKENEKMKLKHMLDTETMVMECIRILYQGHNLDKDIQKVLEQVGIFLQAERTYIFKLRNDEFSNDYEWCAEGVKSQKDILQGIPISIFKRWLSVFEKQECLVMQDLEEYRESDPEEYELLSIQGIHSLVVSPMEKDGVLVGFLGADNPPADKIWNVSSLLQTLCYFILLAFRRAENEKKLSHLSFHDTLTSFYNRNRFMKDIESVANQNIPIGIVYLDVNGLKEANDKYGHECGDKLLIAAADKMKDVFRQADCYRIGGDEFVVFCLNISKEKFEEKVAALKESFDFENDRQCNAAIGAQWTESCKNIKQIVAEADAKMYEDKKEYYKKIKHEGTAEETER
ncbi:diguanylate cyclase [Clostridium sp. chh4-2]|uniref:sensor domain-containing diguanylate cyclase n=1 Tax=Clostridium sp. chh4-2 TaxID=2067550 RepID=UPI000CCF56F4|nr:diguanylate cyclase [Clostridium sp. chh4-2]PNV63274.1 diguanylate cyclase [Clostridium sp. chh4-2]